MSHYSDENEQIKQPNLRGGVRPAAEPVKHIDRHGVVPPNPPHALPSDAWTGRTAVAQHDDIAWQKGEITNDQVDAKPTNPKDLVGSNKVPMHLWPTTATTLGAMALLDGALKYGRSNYRAIGIRASIYYDAALRHLQLWFEGEELDPDSGLPHLAHALACLAVIVDAQAAGKLNDDRMVAGGLRELLDELTPQVAALKARHAGKTPKHYTIRDSPQ